MKKQLVLVINPNSSSSVTDNLEKIVGSRPGYDFTFMTGPKSSPPEIVDEETAMQSTKACLPVIVSQYPNYDGYLVCCFSDHPLVGELSKAMKGDVEGIFQASINEAQALVKQRSGDKYAILTSTKSWEPLLDNSLLKYLGLDEFPDYIEHTLAAEVSVVELNSPEKFQILKGKVQSLVDKGVSIIVLGCAGLSGLDKKFQPEFPDVKFIDPVISGIDYLTK